MSEFDELVNKTVSAHEELTGETPDANQFADIKAVVRDHIQEEDK